MPSLGSFTVARKTIAGTLAGEAQEPTTFQFEGETFTVIDYEPSVLPMMELADALQSGVEEDSNPALAAMYQMLQHCIAEQDWPRFRRTAMASRATIDDVMPIVAAVWEAVTGRPTQRPSDSPDGPSTTTTSSKATSPAPMDRPSSSTADSTSAVQRVPTLDDIEAVADGVVTQGPWPAPPWRPDLAVDLVSVDDLVHKAAPRAA